MKESHDNLEPLRIGGSAFTAWDKSADGSKTPPRLGASAPSSLSTVAAPKKASSKEERVLNFKHKPRSRQQTHEDRPEFKKGAQWREQTRGSLKRQ